MSELSIETKSTPKISVIVPVYNVEKYIHQCIDSILGQTFTDFELLLIDDGSPDNCGAICDEYAVKDSRVRVFHQENAGVSAARNKGLDEARGEWISFVDSDDWIELNLYSLLSNAITSGSYDLVHFGVFDSKQEYSNCSFVYESNQFYVRDYMSKIYSVWCFLFKAELAKRYLFDLRFKYAEDLQFVHKCLCDIQVVFVLDAPFYHYRTSTSSAMASIDNELLLSQNLDVAICILNQKLHKTLNILFASRLINWFIIYGTNTAKFDQKVLAKYLRNIILKVPPFFSKWYVIYWVYALYPSIVKFYLSKNK